MDLGNGNKDMIPIVFLSLHKETPNSGYWDMGFIESMLMGEIWQTVESPTFDIRKDIPQEAKGAVVIIPAAYHKNDTALINKLIKPLDWVFIILTTDEERLFDHSKLKHPNMKLWVQAPRKHLDQNVDKIIPMFYRREAHTLLKHKNHKRLDWFFSGQITHDRRQQAAQHLRRMLDREDLKGELVETPGFTQGLAPDVYYTKMANAKVVPCPSGVASPDSFRLYEALECGAIPIADTLNPQFDSDGFWEEMFYAPPFPILHNYESLEGYIAESVGRYPEYNNEVYAYWQNYKRDFVYDFQDTIKELANV